MSLITFIAITLYIFFSKICYSFGISSKKKKKLQDKNNAFLLYKNYDIKN